MEVSAFDIGACVRKMKDNKNKAENCRKKQGLNTAQFGKTQLVRGQKCSSKLNIDVRKLLVSINIPNALNTQKLFLHSANDKKSANK